jgi:hypothetical protein
MKREDKTIIEIELWRFGMGLYKYQTNSFNFFQISIYDRADAFYIGLTLFNYYITFGFFYE